MEIFILGTAFGALTTYVIQQVMMYYAMRNLQELLGKELFDKLDSLYATSTIRHHPNIKLIEIVKMEIVENYLEKNDR